MDVSCAFATSLNTPDHIAEAERLGYARAWCYDSPPLYPDVWMELALAATKTSRIGLGPAVLVPHLRHVQTNAAAIATLEALAPGRVNVAVGSGFTGRLAMGKRPMPWREVQAYVVALKSLLAGEEVEWEGTVLKMLQTEGFAPRWPVRVPVLVAVGGPKGLAVAEAVADGVILTGTIGNVDAGKLNRVLQTTSGTVLESGEDAGSARSLAAAGHVAALAYHFAYENGFADRLPNGAEYAETIDAIPPERRHLVVHEGHLVAMNEIDRRFVTGEFMAKAGIAAEAGAWRAKLAEMEARGVTEVVYQPAGPDIPRELRAFAEVAGPL
ncbi:MAG TPA: LLM class flavin-dependent oxidoreductase [Dehalococcoidia bacterium]|nr:LLM class flavin-dependent oxidoreductase [Dehalococcoidia bacterium]